MGSKRNKVPLVAVAWLQGDQSIPVAGAASVSPWGGETVLGDKDE